MARKQRLPRRTKAQFVGKGIKVLVTDQADLMVVAYKNAIRESAEKMAKELEANVIANLEEQKRLSSRPQSKKKWEDLKKGVKLEQVADGEWKISIDTKTHPFFALQEFGKDVYITRKAQAHVALEAKEAGDTLSNPPAEGTIVRIPEFGVYRKAALKLERDKTKKAREAYNEEYRSKVVSL